MTGAHEADAWLAGLIGEVFGARGRVLRPRGIGWATVELDRAVAELSALLPGRPTFEPAGDDEHLGARCRVARPRHSVPWVILEPSTEGRLAAFLVRHGEGLVAAWVESIDPPVALSKRGRTALGQARLVVGRTPAAAQVFVLEPETASGGRTPGTIET